MTIPDPASTAFVFPGQGSQKLGMGRELAAAYHAAKRVFEQADALLEAPLSRVCWEGPEEELNDTVNTQPALLVHSVAALTVFEDLFGQEFGEAKLQATNRPKVAFVAGHSLGELSALVAAGALDFAGALRLVRRRGELMKSAGEQNPGGMAAILGLDIPTLDEICARASTGGEFVQVANDNCPGQVVISGHAEAVDRAMAAAKEAGAKRALPLAVSIAAHSPLMAPAQDEFAQAIAASAIVDPHIPIVGNVTAEPMANAEDIRADLQGQLTARVRWTESVLAMAAAGGRTFIELGSGNVLTRLLRRIDPELEGVALGAPGDFEKFSSQ